MEPSSRVATIAAVIGILAAIAFVGAPLAIQAGWASPFVGFRAFMLATLLGLVAFLLGCVGLWTTRPAAGRGGRGMAVTGALLGALLVGVVLASAGCAAGLPAINDITTNPDDPPRFVAVAELEGNEGEDLSYPGEEFAAKQRDAYPDLEPIRLDAPPRDAFARAVEAAGALGWKIVERDAEAGRLEAVDVTRIFRFRDDVVVRVRPDDGGSVVDLRSRSRVGRGDLGANAARIRAFRERLEGGGSG